MDKIETGFTIFNYSFSLFMLRQDILPMVVKAEEIDFRCFV